MRILMANADLRHSHSISRLEQPHMFMTYGYYVIVTFHVPWIRGFMYKFRHVNVSDFDHRL